MELKARLASLEHQINSLQSLLHQSGGTGSGCNNENYNYSKFDNNSQNVNLKTILMKLKLEHEAVLRSIEKALELVDNNSTTTDNLRTPEKTSTTTFTSSSPSSPRLKDKINVALFNTKHHQVITSSPLSPSLEKSHITFDILNELEEQQNHSSAATTNKRKVHFDSGEEMSVASKEYLRKYGLI